jgi:O-acetylhomoserine (thiol)-lyase
MGPAAYIARIRTVLLRNTGAALSPFNAFLILQGLETLPLRMERASANALAVARHLKGRAGVTWVNYPGLEDDAYHDVATRILNRGKGFGGILSFGVDGGREAGRRFIEALELFTHLANIGDSRSLAIHNASTTHSQLNDEELAKAGVGADMVRLSIGIENVEDIIADIDQALAKAQA